MEPWIIETVRRVAVALIVLAAVACGLGILLPLVGHELPFALMLPISIAINSYVVKPMRDHLDSR